MQTLFDSLFRDLQWTYPTTSGYTYTDDGVTLTYYKNGIVHNDKGPAIKHRDGKVEYWLNGKQTTKETVDALIEERENSRKVKVTVDGTTYTITSKQLKELNLHDTLQQLT